MFEQLCVHCSNDLLFCERMYDAETHIYMYSHMNVFIIDRWRESFRSCILDKRD
jgi:hypothetical protein